MKVSLDYLRRRALGAQSIMIDEQWLRDIGFTWVEHDRKFGGFELRIGPGKDWETVFRLLPFSFGWLVEIATVQAGADVDWTVAVGCLELFRLRADLLRLIRLVTFRDWTPGGES